MIPSLSSIFTLSYHGFTPKYDPVAPKEAFTVFDVLGITLQPLEGCLHPTTRHHTSAIGRLLASNNSASHFSHWKAACIQQLGTEVQMDKPRVKCPSKVAEGSQELRQSEDGVLLHGVLRTINAQSAGSCTPHELLHERKCGWWGAWMPMQPNIGIFQPVIVSPITGSF